ncbi:hypothetical protein Sliba_33170 [Streptomyces nigrescens]|uniref:Uncharacterized protein n=1 Tax=Streptomyces nigrescens TaxID=1920 RepID=A0A640TI68_STRNI|nr:hypothetical protein Sliba_33170 [Streptomyces libani subsp. libani]GGW06858.1 hypothetical protein GCM10010500_74140 [Streptomyces libani subsp. libani]
MRPRSGEPGRRRAAVAAQRPRHVRLCVESQVRYCGAPSSERTEEVRPIPRQTRQVLPVHVRAVHPMQVTVRHR